MGPPSRDSGNRPALVAAAAAPAAQAALLAKLQADDSTLQATFGATGPPALSAYVAPLAEHVVSYSPTTAVVDVWAVAATIRQGVPLAASFWAVQRIHLTWAGDWKWADSSYTLGPTPSTGTPAGDPQMALSGFTAKAILGAQP